MKIQRRSLYFIGAGLFVILFLISVFAGIMGKEFTETARLILFKIRIPRTVAALVCGAALSVSGLILQTTLNNTLASPGIIGINSGAGFFVLVVSLIFPFGALARTLGAFAGAVLAVLIVYFISEKAGVSKTTLILAGVAVSSLMSAGIDVVITLHPEIVADKVAFNLGGFQNISISSLYFAIPVIVAGIVILIFLSGGIDLFALGDEAAYGLGLNVRACRIAAILISGILAGCAVSICGLLGFVGLIIPNFVRLAGKANTRSNIFMCMILGSDFLMLCDLIARFLFYPYELPVGLFLSCLGSPFFIWMLIRKKKRLGV